jgi:hypothetical protein
MANAGVSPDGYANADKFIPDSASQGVLQQNHSITASQTNTFSVFAKDGGLNDRFVVNSRDNASTSNSATISFNLSTGTIATAPTSSGTFSAASGTITPYGNGWYRLTLTYTCSATITARFRYFNGGTSGDGTNGYLVYGAQLELNAAYATSYIKTEAAAVSRLEDATSKTGITSLIGQTEGTIFVEMDTQNISESVRIIEIGEGAVDNRIVLRLTVSRVNVIVTSSGVSQGSFSSAVLTNGNYKIALGYAENNFALFINGTLSNSSDSASVPACPNLYLGYTPYTGSPLGGRIGQALLFKTRLTNAQLAELTSL